MKYFSPSVLDGSITTAKLADGAVDTLQLANGAVEQLKMGLNAVDSAQIAAGAVVTSKLSSGLSSQSGAIGGNGTVTIALDAYSFAPDIIFDSTDLDKISLNSVAVVAGSADADNPRWAIDNTTAAGVNYDIEWRRVTG